MGLSNLFSATRAGNNQEAVDASLRLEDNLRPKVETDTKDISGDHEGFSDNAQTGVQKVEAAAMAWDKSHLIACYTL